MPYAEQLRKIKRFLRIVFAHETLEQAPIAANHRDHRRQFAAILFRREPLALDPELPPRAPRPGILSALFAAEVLPEDPPEPPRSASAPARRGLARALFAREPLPELPPAPAKPARAAWLRWLFRFERLDPP